jgi:hypothetical protein
MLILLIPCIIFKLNDDGLSGFGFFQNCKYDRNFSHIADNFKNKFKIKQSILILFFCEYPHLPAVIFYKSGACFEKYFQKIVWNKIALYSEV